jgi:hypothetical protein
MLTSQSVQFIQLKPDRGRSRNDIDIVVRRYVVAQLLVRMLPCLHLGLNAIVTLHDNLVPPQGLQFFLLSVL